MKISGQKIREIRESKNMKRAELSRTSGISLRTLENWELGKRYPRNIDLIDTLANALSVNISDLYDDEYITSANSRALHNSDLGQDSEHDEIEMTEAIESIFAEQGIVGILKVMDRFIYALGIPHAHEIVMRYIDESSQD